MLCGDTLQYIIKCWRRAAGVRGYAIYRSHVCWCQYMRGYVVKKSRCMFSRPPLSHHRANIYLYLATREIPIVCMSMAHKVFIRHTYIYQCDSCNGEWKINEAKDIEKLSCPHCGKNSSVEYVHEDQRKNHYRRYIWDSHFAPLVKNPKVSNLFF